MGARIELHKGEPEILQLVLSYMGRRFFDPADTDRLLQIESNLEDARRHIQSGRATRLILDSDEVATLLRALSSYLEEFDVPTSNADRAQLRVVHRFGARLQRGLSLWGRFRGWLAR
jgi:hypothetical protein